jgi:TPR repeat protein
MRLVRALIVTAMLSACGPPSTIANAPTTVTRTCHDGDLAACDRECSSGSGESCFQLGAAHEEGNGVAKDAKRAAALYLRACDLGFGTACGERAVMILEGVVPGEPSEAAALCAKGCDAKSAASCALLGSMYQEGSGVEANASTAAQLYERACDLGEARGCSALGYLYFDGRGVPHDETKGRALIEKGCKAGDTDACKVIKELGTAAP